MRADIREAMQAGRLLWRQCFQTPRGLYTISIVKHKGDYFAIKRNDGVVVEAKNIRRDMDEAQAEPEEPEA